MKSIITIGDSIVTGRGETPNLGWAGRLKKDFESKETHHILYNLGIPGDSTTGLVKRIETEIKARAKYYWPGDKHITIIGIGINDTRAIDNPKNVQTKKSKFKSNIFKIIKFAKKLTDKVIILGLTNVNESLTNPFDNTYFINSRIKEYNAIIKEQAKKQNVVFIDMFNLLNKKNLTDGLHPNTKGYDKMYKLIKKEIKKFKI